MIFKLLFGKALLNALDRLADADRSEPPVQHTEPLSAASAPALSPIHTVFPRVERRAMGSLFEIYLAGRERDALVAAGEEALDQIERLDGQLSHYRNDSDISRLNANGAEHWVRVEPRLYQLIRRCLTLSRDTDGGFDITAGPLIKAWGFFRGEGRVPTCDELAAVMERTGFYRVLTDDGESLVHFSCHGMEMHLGAVGKGYAIDEAAAILRFWGVKSAVIHGGQSTIYAMGDAPDDAGTGSEFVVQNGEPAPSAAWHLQDANHTEDPDSEFGTWNSELAQGWKFVIKDPRDRVTPLQEVWLKDEALSTSGNYEQFFEHEGVRYTHIIDPVTGRPCSGMISVSVICKSAADSDALSTAFFVLGREATQEYCRIHPNIRVVMVEEAENGEISVTRIGL